MLLSQIAFHVPSVAELVTAIPVIISLIVIEGLLSIDNAMAIAAMASNLPKHLQNKALRFGIIGAYLFRGICLVLAAWIAQSQWLKLFGALYLLYLMCNHLTSEEEEDGGASGHRKVRGFIATILAIEMMDLTLSLDNIVAAVALDKRLWVVCTGVFIGILVMRFIAGYCIILIEKFPILQKTAFLLVGFVGFVLVVELVAERMHYDLHINSYVKFAGILSITIGSIMYAHTALGKRVLHPLVRVGTPAIRIGNTVLGYVMLPVFFIFSLLKKGYYLLKDWALPDSIEEDKQPKANTADSSVDQNAVHSHA